MRRAPPVGAISMRYLLYALMRVLAFSDRRLVRAGSAIGILFAAVMLAASSGPDDRRVTDPKSLDSPSNPAAKPIPIDELYFTRSVGGASWSPDGKEIVFTVAAKSPSRVSIRFMRRIPKSLGGFDRLNERTKVFGATLSVIPKASRFGGPEPAGQTPGGRTSVTGSRPRLFGRSLHPANSARVGSTRSQYRTHQN